MGQGILDRILRKVTYYDWSGIPVAPCNLDNYDSLWLMMGNNTWLEIPPEVYVMEYDLGDDWEDWCVIGFTVNTEEYFLIGDTFLRSYYSIHDDENALLGLVPHKNSNATIYVGD